MLALGGRVQLLSKVEGEEMMLRAVSFVFDNAIGKSPLKVFCDVARSCVSVASDIDSEIVDRDHSLG